MVGAVVVLIYALVEFKRMRHKVFAMVLIGLIVFSYISAVVIFKDEDVDLKSVSGIISATRLYFSWFGNIFVNVKTITTNAVKMDWNSNKSIEDFQDPIVETKSSK